MKFTHDTLGQRVVLDTGNAAAQLAAEVGRLGAERMMLIAGGSAERFADEIRADLPVALRWRDVTQHVPVALAERAREAALEAGIDLLVSIGGGSAVGLAKAIALTTRTPIIAIPTTYAGSKATPVWGMTEERTKTTGRDVAVLPATVIYDSSLTVDLPVDTSVASGLNALAHCVDTMWAPGADPINQTLALEGMRALSDGLPRLVTEPRGIEGRDQCLYGAYLAAVRFASAGSALHHKICHLLGGMFDLPHAQTHAIVLPHVLAYNAPAVPDSAARMTQALGGARTPADEPAAALASLERLYDAVRAPRALRELGMPADGIGEVAARTVAVAPATNPRPVTEQAMRSLLSAAWAGDAPGGAA